MILGLGVYCELRVSFEHFELFSADTSYIGWDFRIWKETLTLDAGRLF